jgi:hypothetical protein
MIRISNEQQLLSAFRDSDRGEVYIPADFAFPFTLKDYVAWVEPSGHRVYLVFQEVQSGHPMGVVFQRTRGAADTPASMCQWCHSVRPGTAVGLLTTAAGPNRRIGLHLCANLDCKEHAMKPPGVNDFPEAVQGRDKVERIVRRMNDFAKHNLF